MFPMEGWKEALMARVSFASLQPLIEYDIDGMIVFIEFSFSSLYSAEGIQFNQSRYSNERNSVSACQRVVMKKRVLIKS